MTATIFAPPDEIVRRSGISWKTSETLLKELSDRRLRLTYNRGNLEIMAPAPEHELNQRVLGRFIETIAEELNYPRLQEVANLAQMGGSFNFLDSEPDLYTIDDGEPID